MSPDGNHIFVMQGDGNAVIYNMTSGGATWLEQELVERELSRRYLLTKVTEIWLCTIPLARFIGLLGQTEKRLRT